MRAKYSPAFPGASTRRRRAGGLNRLARRFFRWEHDFASAKHACPAHRENPILIWNDAQGGRVRGRGRRGGRRVARLRGGVVTRPAMLIVSHDEATRSQLRERIVAISPPGMEVVAAASAEEGLGLLYSLREQNRPIELGIASQAMPRIPGGRFLEIVNAQSMGVG